VGQLKSSSAKKGFFCITR